MIETVFHEAADRVGWETCVRQCGGHGLLMPGVYRVEHPDEAISLLRFEEAGQLLGCAVSLDQRPGWRGRLRGRERVMLLPVAPAIAEPGAASAIRGTIFARARASGASRLIVQPAFGRWLLQDEDLTPWRKAAVTEFVLDLERSHEDLLASMHKVHRKNIRRAARAGLEVVEDSSLDALLRLRQLQLASSSRADERTEGFAVQDEEFFRRAHEHVYGAGLGHVLFARAEGADLAALAWVEAAERIITVRSGGLPAGYESRAMYLLHDELIRRAQARGVRELNIGGVPSEASQPGHAQSGLWEFKHGFGGRAEQRFALEIPLGEIEA